MPKDLSVMEGLDAFELDEFRTECESAFMSSPNPKLMEWLSKYGVTPPGPSGVTEIALLGDYKGRDASNPFNWEGGYIVFGLHVDSPLRWSNYGKTMENPWGK